MSTGNNSETAIRLLVENWAEAVRNKDLAGILAHHDEDIIMYDVPEPFQSRGIEAYIKTWDTYYAWSQNNLGIFDIRELHITAGEDVAYCCAAMRCAGVDENNEDEFLDFRLTIGFKKIDGQWWFMHEHHSLPAI
jgi:ketosteroid isomerase-like protein